MKIRHDEPLHRPILIELSFEEAMDLTSVLEPFNVERVRNHVREEARDDAARIYDLTWKLYSSIYDYYGA